LKNLCYLAYFYYKASKVKDAACGLVLGPVRLSCRRLTVSA